MKGVPGKISLSGAFHIVKGILQAALILTTPHESGSGPIRASGFKNMTEDKGDQEQLMTSDDRSSPLELTENTFYYL